jgi:PAS domain S-box-containing protein
MQNGAPLPGRGSYRAYAAERALALKVRFLEANLTSIPECVYAFDRERRFAYVNAKMAALFGLAPEDMIGRTFADLDYESDLASLLNGHIDEVFETGLTVEDEVFSQSPVGLAACFEYLWGPVRGEDGSVDLVIGVSRDVSQRREAEEALKRSEARLRAASDLVGLGIYSWDPVTGSFNWDERLRAMWGLPADAPVDMTLFEAGIHPDDLAIVREAIAKCLDPTGDGRYNVEYRVIGKTDGVTRHIATSGRMTFSGGRAVNFIGAAIDMTAQRHAEAKVKASEAQFRAFADHSSNLLWIADPLAGKIVLRSAACQSIWGIACEEAEADMSNWLLSVYPEDRPQVEHVLAAVAAGEVIQHEYRIVRPPDGALRWLRETSFPILDDAGNITRIGGVTEDLTQDDVGIVYIVSPQPGEARKLAGLVRALGHRVRIFDGASSFLNMAAVLTPGTVLLDLRKRREEGLSVPRELKARSIPFAVIGLDAQGADAATVVAAMKAGVVDYVTASDEEDLRSTLLNVLVEFNRAVAAVAGDESASARISGLTPREREVISGLVDGQTNKMIAQKLGISPRTVELHRSQAMKRLGVYSLTNLLQVALAAGIKPSAPVSLGKGM